jgi:cytochrome c biogenesis factor
MTQAAITELAVALAATTARHRRGAFIALILIVMIAGVAYYAWRRRKLRQKSDNDRL